MKIDYRLVSGSVLAGLASLAIAAAPASAAPAPTKAAQAAPANTMAGTPGGTAKSTHKMVKRHKVVARRSHHEAARTTK